MCFVKCYTLTSNKHATPAEEYRYQVCFSLSGAVDNG